MAKNVKLIAEIGINHNGSFEIAKSLILHSKKSNADAIKFQYRNLGSAYSASANREIGDEILLAQINESYLSPKELLELTKYAHFLNLDAGISFFDSKDILDFTNEIKHFDFFKVPSAELTNHDLIKDLIKIGKHIYISTGAHTETEIEQSLNLLPKYGWTPLHCISNYPLKVENAKLGYIKYLRKKWDRDVGYSSHDELWEMCIFAMENGASVIERHITLDKNSRGLDHSSSSTPEEFKKLSLIARNLDLLQKGENERVINQGERLNRQNLGRSYFFTNDLKKGQKILYTNIEYKSPYIGISKTNVNQFINKPILQPVKKGTSLTPSLFCKFEPLTHEQIEFSNKKNISLPVRFHDYELISESFPICAYELHLSFEETLSRMNVNKLDFRKKYSIHLPDYINTNDLIDPFSKIEDKKQLSFEIIHKVADLAKELQDKTGKKVPIVGSFSIVGESKIKFYERLSELIQKFYINEVYIFPQWLPPVAWYFGGSVSLNSFCSEEDVSYIDDLQIPICMDFCHLFMGASYFVFNAENVLQKLKRLIKHVHISEASGFDGEGMQFGEGDPGQAQIIGDNLDIDCIKVIEVWQGHLDQGAGFRKAIKRLQKLYGQS